MAIIFWQPLTGLASNPDQLKTSVKEAGIFGPIIFVFIQFMQILVAPIPGQVVGVVAGALFGVWLGGIYSLVGSAIGMATVILLVRKLGRPFVDRFVSSATLKKFDYLTNNNGAVVFFLIMLLPGFPDDIVCFLAGLSKVPVRTLLIVGLLGRAPTTFGSAAIGAGISDVNIPLVTLLVSLVAVAGVIGYWQRKRLERFVKRIATKDE